MMITYLLFITGFW